MRESLLSVGNDASGNNARKNGHFKGRKKMADEQNVQETAREQAMKSAQDAADAKNKERSGKGTRLSVSSTRGKNPTPVTYESFDENVAGSLPETVAEFMQLSGVDDEATLVSYLITGFNDASFRIASDPVAEFVNPVWPAEVAKSFKDAVKTLVKSGVTDLDGAVAMIKPSVDAKFAPASQG